MYCVRKVLGQTKERDYTGGSLDIRMDLCVSAALNLLNFYRGLLNEEGPYQPSPGLGWRA